MRSVWAVIAGLVVIVVLSTATDLALHATGVYPPIGQPMSGGRFLLALGYRFVFGVAGCALAARLAPSRPMRHALILGGVGVLLSTAGAIATWGRGPEFGPPWYPLALIAITMPSAWLGGVLGGRRGAAGMDARPGPA